MSREEEITKILKQHGERLRHLEGVETSAVSVYNVPAGGIAAGNVQAAINELDAEKRAITDGLVFVRADKDGDLDYDPLTSTSWDGDAYAAGNGTINWNTVFGVPLNAKAVQVYVGIQDETLGVALGLRAKSTTTSWAFLPKTVIANQVEGKQGIVLVAANGTSYYLITDELDNVYMRVVGWYL